MVLAEAGWAPSRIELALGINQEEQRVARAEMRDRIARAQAKLKEMYDKASRAGYSKGEVQGQVINAIWQWWQAEYGRAPNAQERRLLGIV